MNAARSFDSMNSAEIIATADRLFTGMVARTGITPTVLAAMARWDAAAQGPVAQPTSTDDLALLHALGLMDVAA